MADWLLDGIVAWLLSFTVGALNQLWALLAQVAFITPDVTAAPQVVAVLVGIAPIALACHALPHTDGAARLWWRTLIGCLSVVALQAFALHTTVSIFLDPRANLGLPQDRSGMFNLFIVACLLWVTVRIPALVRRYVTHSGGRNVGGYLLRAVVIQQLTVDGARTSVNAMGIPAWRSRSASSMLSAPAHIAATSETTLASAFAPPLLAAPRICTCRRTRSGRPHRSASRTTGTKPASAIRFGSSNDTEAAPGV
jgi:hypothetical protein